MRTVQLALDIFKGEDYVAWNLLLAAITFVALPPASYVSEVAGCLHTGKRILGNQRIKGTEYEKTAQLSHNND